MEKPVFDDKFDHESMTNTLNNKIGPVVWGLHLYFMFSNVFFLLSWFIIVLSFTPIFPHCWHFRWLMCVDIFSLFWSQCQQHLFFLFSLNNMYFFSIYIMLMLTETSHECSKWNKLSLPHHKFCSVKLENDRVGQRSSVRGKKSVRRPREIGNSWTSRLWIYSCNHGKTLPF